MTLDPFYPTHHAGPVESPPQVRNGWACTASIDIFDGKYGVSLDVGRYHEDDPGAVLTLEVVK